MAHSLCSDCISVECSLTCSLYSYVEGIPFGDNRGWWRRWGGFDSFSFFDSMAEQNCMTSHISLIQ